MTDYRQLERFLTDRLWQDADIETARLMRAVVHQLRLDEPGLSKSDRKQLLGVRYICEAEITNYPTDELRAIDQLWNEASGGKFGFTVQRQVWSDYCGELRAIGDEGELQATPGQYRNFAEKVGWAKKMSWLPYPELRFDIDAPKGHLPAAPFYAEEIGTGWAATLVEKLRC